MIPWWWAIVIAILSGSFGALIFAVIASGKIGRGDE